MHNTNFSSKVCLVVHKDEQKMEKIVQKNYNVNIDFFKDEANISNLVQKM